MLHAGIVAEYDPFHCGHASQIAACRARGAETVSAVMSGNFVQRGSPAVFSKFTRARAAIDCGADAVAELPVSWAAAGADRFAEGAVFLLSAMGCDTLCFGAECTDIGLLVPIAALLEDPGFDAELTEKHTAGGGSLAALRARLAEARLPGAAAVLAGPNNVLGIAYLRAIRRLGLPLQALALPRTGAGHDETDLPETGTVASASALRRCIAAGEPETVRRFVPAAAWQLYDEAIRSGAVLDPHAFDVSLLTRLRCLREEDFAALPDAGGEGLPNLLARACRGAAGAQQLYGLLKSKRYTHARLRRLALEAYLGIPGDLPRLPPYLRLFGGTDAGLRQMKAAKRTGLPAGSSLARFARLPGEAGRTAALEARAGALWSLCLKVPQPADGEYTEKLYRPEENERKTAGPAVPGDLRLSPSGRSR